MFKVKSLQTEHTNIKKSRPLSLIACIVFGFFSIGLMLTSGDYKENSKVLIWDVACYYNYLPAVFKYHSLDFEKLPLRYGYITSADGIVSEKMTMGLAFLYLPFYLIAWLYVGISGLPYDEYSAPFCLLISLSAIFYMLAGMVVLRRVLLKYFSDVVVTIGLCCVFLGTNMVYYTAYEGGMSHVFSFFLIAASLSLLIAWHEKPKWGTSVVLGLVAGLIILVRPSNAAILLIALLWNTHSKDALRTKYQLIKSHIPKILAIAFCAFLVWLPQMAYWNYATGHWVYFSYSGEQFYFNNPHIFQGMFSYRNGWLVYAPVMMFSLIGMFFLRKNLKPWFWPVVVYFLVTIYVIFSWWCWWYVGFGMRAMIDLYAVLSIPLCAVIAKTFTLKNYLKVPAIFLLCCLLLIGLFKNYQYKKSIIHFDSMTGKAYWNSFYSRSIPEGNYYKLFKSPDYERAKKGEE